MQYDTSSANWRSGRDVQHRNRFNTFSRPFSHILLKCKPWRQQKQPCFGQKKMMRVKLKDESHRQTWIIGRRGRSPCTVRQGKWPAICILTDSLLASFLLHGSLRVGLIRLKRFVFMLMSASRKGNLIVVFDENVRSAVESWRVFRLFVWDFFILFDLFVLKSWHF